VNDFAAYARSPLILPLPPIFIIEAYLMVADARLRDLMDLTPGASRFGSLPLMPDSRRLIRAIGYFSRVLVAVGTAVRTDMRATDSVSGAVEQSCDVYR
jgi:hypothetical protein